MDEVGGGVERRPADDGDGDAGERSLDSVRRGGRCTVLGVVADTPRPVAQRLRDLGFRAETPVEVVRRAPLGSPTVYRVGESDICLRRTEAARIRVRVGR